MYKFRRNDRISVTPLGFFLLTHSNHTGVSLRSTTCLWSRQPFGLFTLGEINLQGFRYAPPPACNLNPPLGLCCLDVWRRKDFDVWSRKVDGWSGALCAVPMWDVGSTSSFITSLLAEGDHFHRPTSFFRLQKHFPLQEWFFILKIVSIWQRFAFNRSIRSLQPAHCHQHPFLWFQRQSYDIKSQTPKISPS